MRLTGASVRYKDGLAGYVLLLLVLVGALLAPVAPAVAESLACAEQPSVLVCDADDDGIVDVVEEAICGSATCATGTEDLDGNGVADAEELAGSLASGGPAGPVQPASADSVIVVSADGTITVVSLWTVAAGAAVFLAALTVCVLRRRAASVSPA